MVGEAAEDSILLVTLLLASQEITVLLEMGGQVRPHIDITNAIFD